VNPRTGEVVTEEFLKGVDTAVRQEFVPVPKRLRGEARDALGGRQSAHIDPQKQPGMQAWAAHLNKKTKKRRSKNKVARKSRRHNR
jgi:hypothetical protein